MQKVKKYYRILLVVFVILVLYVTFFLKADTVSKNIEDNIKTKNSAVENSSAINEIEGDLEKEKTEEKVVAEEVKEAKEIIVYSFNENDEESTVFSGLLNYGQESDIEIEYNNNYDFGVFIESIGGIKNGDNGKYWQYYINDVLGDVAADKKVLEEKDNVEWRFEEVPF